MLLEAHFVSIFELKFDISVALQWPHVYNQKKLIEKA